MRLHKNIRSVFNTLPDPLRTPPDYSRQTLLVKSMAWTENYGFQNPVSALVIFDTFLEFGHMPAHITYFVQEPTPAQGGDEETWVKWLLFLRASWLGSCRNPNLRADGRLAVLEIKMGELR